MMKKAFPLVLAFMLANCLPIAPASAQSAGQAITLTTVYKSIIKSHNEVFEENRPRLAWPQWEDTANGDGEYMLLDLNHDGINELLLNYSVTGPDTYWSSLVFSYDPSSKQVYLAGGTSLGWGNRWWLAQSTTKIDTYYLMSSGCSSCMIAEVINLESFSINTPRVFETDQGYFPEEYKKANRLTGTSFDSIGYMDVGSDVMVDSKYINRHNIYQYPQTSKTINWDEEKQKAEAKGLSFFHGTVHLVTWDEAQDVIKNEYYGDTISKDLLSDKTKNKTFIVLTSDTSQDVVFGANGSLPAAEKNIQPLYNVFYWPDDALANFKNLEGNEVGIVYDYHDAFYPQDAAAIPARGIIINSYKELVTDQSTPASDPEEPMNGDSNKSLIIGVAIAIGLILAALGVAASLGLVPLVTL